MSKETVKKSMFSRITLGITGTLGVVSIIFGGIIKF